MAMSTVHDSLKQFVDAVLSNIGTLIKLPNSQECCRLADRFYTYKFPNVIGAIDGTLLEVQLPDGGYTDCSSTEERKTAVKLTVLCDADKRLLSINLGRPSQDQDGDIFVRSKLYHLINEKKVVPEGYHIVGSAAYGLTVNVMVPYTGDNLPIHKEAYNKAHLSTKMIVERCLADLKSRWLRLHCLRSDIEFVNKLVATCCCLHNLCIDYGDIRPTRRAHVVENSGNQELAFESALSKRDAIAVHVLNS